MEGVSFCDEELSVGRGDGYFCLDTRFFSAGRGCLDIYRSIYGWMDGWMHGSAKNGDATIPGLELKTRPSLVAVFACGVRRRCCL